MLEGLLGEILGGPMGDRVVVVSNSTKSLDLVSALCSGRGWATVRICGDVSAARRQDIVTAFNRHNVGQVPPQPCPDRSPSASQLSLMHVGSLWPAKKGPQSHQTSEQEPPLRSPAALHCLCNNFFHLFCSSIVFYACTGPNHQYKLDQPFYIFVVGVRRK